MAPENNDLSGTEKNQIKLSYEMRKVLFLKMQQSE